MFLLLENVRENLRSNQNMDHSEKRDTVQRQTKHGPSGDTRHRTKTNKTWTIRRHETQNKDKHNMDHQ